MAVPHITQLPPAPVRGEPFDEFTAKANAHVAALTPWTTQVNELADYVEERAGDADGSASEADEHKEDAQLAAIGAQASALESQEWATKRGSSVSDNQWSAEEHAIGEAVTTGSAKSWASGERDVPVADGEYSAKHYSLVAEDHKDTAEAAAAAAQAAAGLPAIADKERYQLTVNGAANGVEWTPPMFNWWENPSELRVLASYLSGVFSDLVVEKGNTGTAMTLDVTEGGEQTATLTGNCVITLSGANTVAGRTSSTTLVLANDGTAGRSVSFAGGTIRYPGGLLVRTTAANAVDRYFIMTNDGGATWDISIPQANLQTP